MRVRIPAAFFVVNDRKAFSKRLRQVGDKALSIVLLLLCLGSATSLGQQLALRFEPIGLIVARQSKSAPAFGNEIGSKANGVL